MEQYISKLLYKSEPINVMGLNKRKQGKAAGEVKALQTLQFQGEKRQETVILK